jgi:hypothetical protein
MVLLLSEDRILSRGPQQIYYYCLLTLAHVKKKALHLLLEGEG